MTRAFFEAQMARMTGLRFVPADLETHWEGLQDLPEGVLEAAVSRAVKVRIDFPVPQELRQDADIVAQRLTREPDEDRGVDLAEPVTIGTLPTGTPVVQRRVWRFYCNRCDDSGWEWLWCGDPMMLGDLECDPFRVRMRCERCGDHRAHSWARRCACWDTNPALVKKRERQQQYAEAKATGRRGGLSHE